MSANPSITLGLLEKWRQFSLLLLVNAFVGAMVGLERTIVPLIAFAANQMAQIEGDFEKGSNNGSDSALEVISMRAKACLR